MFRTLHPEKVYVTEDVYDDARAAARVDRMMEAVEGATLEKVSCADLNAVAGERWQDLRDDWRWGWQERPRDPDLVMTTAKFLTDEQKEDVLKRHPNLRLRDLAGLTTHAWRDHGEPRSFRARRGAICQSAWQLHTIMGCPFRCAYCGYGSLIRILVNIEAYVEHLDAICALPPLQRLYKWDNATDVSAFEPEYGASRLLVEYFANKPGRYLEIYAGKSDNVDNLLELQHGGKTIVQWSISPRTQSTVIEPETAPWDRRIEAARACHEAGYITRFRFSPMVPVRNWEDEYAELVARIFERSRPDVISLCAFGWMDVGTARRCLDFSLLDPRYVAAMEEAAPFLESRAYTGGGGRPVPHDARAHMFKTVIDEIRKHSRTIPISLCLETVEMWALFQRELGMRVDPERRNNYYCNCGPQCTPEHPLCRGVTPGWSWYDAPA